MPNDPISLRQRLIGAGLVNLACLVWSTNMILGRYLRGDIGPITLAAFRFTIASVPLALVLLRQPAGQRTYAGAVRPILAMTATGFFLFTICIYWGLHHTTASNGALFQALSPLITALLAGVLIGEPANRRQAVGAVIAFFGAIGLISGGSWTTLLHASFNIGDMVMLAAAVLWALFTIAGRAAMRKRGPAAATALAMFPAAALLWPLALWELRSQPVDFSPTLILALLHIGLVPTLIGMWTWNAGVKILSASGAMVFYNTLPMYALILAALFLGEQLAWPHYVFGSAILAGGVWGSLPPGRG